MSSDYIAQMQFRLHVKTNEEIKYRNEINFLKEQCIFAVYCKTSKNNQLQNIQTDTSSSKLNLIQKCGSNIVEQREEKKELNSSNLWTNTEPLNSIAYKLNVFCTLTLKLLTPY